MTIVPFLIYDGEILSNFCQFRSYAQNGHVSSDCWQVCFAGSECCCVEVDETAGLVFNDPTDADWYDPSNPCSAEFAGFIVTDIEYGRGFRRRVTNTIDGGLVGRRNLLAREIDVVGYIVSSSECGKQFGLEWLNSKLDNQNCADGNCAKPELKIAACCDTGDPSKGVRVLKNVKALTPATEEDREDILASCGAKVEFTLSAEIPYFFKDLTDIAADQPVSDVPAPNWCKPACSGSDIWPDCGPTNNATNVADSLVTRDSGVKCFCEPVFVSTDCFQIDGNPDLPTFLNWSITSAQDLQNVNVVLYESQGAGTDPVSNPDLYQCAVLSKSDINFIPAGHTISYDSSSKTVLVTDSAGGNVDPLGVGFIDRAIMECDSGFLCISIDCRNDVAGSTISVSQEFGAL